LKRLIGILFAVVLLAGLVVSPVVFAADPTIVNTTWDGAGAVTVVGTVKNDAVVNFGAVGGYINGNLNITGNNDNPYNYGVDSVSSYVQSYIQNGYSSFELNRTDAYVPMYGIAGQSVYSYIYADGGSAAMATGSAINYASMVNGTYSKPKTASGFNYEADATSFVLQNYVGNGEAGASTGNWASFSSVGSGTAKINNMTTEASAGQVQLGAGGGCYTNANALLSGTGVWTTSAVGTTQITVPSGGGLVIPGSGFGTVTYTQQIQYSGTNFSIPDFSLKVK